MSENKPRYLILTDRNSASSNVTPASIKGVLVESPEVGIKFVYTDHSSGKIVDTGRTIEDVGYPPADTKADLQLVLDDGSFEYVLTL